METVEIKERPILFSGDMVRAILEGRKTQTRRIAKLKSKKLERYKGGWFWDYNPAYIGDSGEDLYELCPYGAPGDQLWVRETWGTGTRPCPMRGWYDGIEYRADEGFIDDKELLPLYDLDSYKNVPDNFEPDSVHGWKPSIHMPRWASRIQLEIADVRVERVQDISEEDAIREGILAVDSSGNHVNPIEYEYRKWYRNYESKEYSFMDPIASFWTLWNFINEKRGFGWDANPFVWVIDFKRAG